MTSKIEHQLQTGFIWSATKVAMKNYSLVINGALLSATDYFTVHNPSTDASVGNALQAGKAELDKAVAAARVVFESWSKLSDAELEATCNAVTKKVNVHAEELVALITEEQGKPLNGLGARWNFPAMISILYIMTARRIGNTVFIKPSPHTPLATIQTVELMNKVLQAGVVNVVTASDDGDDNIGALMSGHPGIAKIVLTGSTGTGKKVMMSATETVKWLYVYEGIHDAVCGAPVAFAKNTPVGDSKEENSTLGPVQNRMQSDKASLLFADAKEVAQRMKCGLAWINKHGAIQPNAPLAALRNPASAPNSLKSACKGTPTSRSYSLENKSKGEQGNEETSHNHGALSWPDNWGICPSA